jgi:hypothetical protein
MNSISPINDLGLRRLRVTLTRALILGFTGLSLLHAWAMEPYSFIDAGNRFDINADARLDFFHNIYGQGLIDSLQSPGSYRVFTNSYQLGCRSTAQILITADQAPPLVFLVDPGMAVGATPPPGATWATSSRGFPIYFQEGYGQSAGPDPTTYYEIYTAVYGPLADKPEGYAIGRYQAPDGWHYGWLKFSTAGTYWKPAGQYDLTAWSFHTRPSLPIYAGEDATPRLRAVLGEGGLTISWTSREEGFVLESAPLVQMAVWIEVPGVVRDGLDYQVTLPVGPGQRYFRLRK